MKEEIYDIKKLLLIKKVYMKSLSGQEEFNAGFAVFAEALNEHEFASQQELSKFVGCNKAHTSRTLLKMQLKGLVKQSCKSIALTGKGKAYAEKAKENIRQLTAKLFKNINKDDAQTFFRVLDQIFDNAEEHV